MLDWYFFNKSGQYVETIMKNVQKAIVTISAFPTVGVVEKITSKRVYRSIITHPKSRLYYWYDEDSVHIVRFVNTQTDY